MQEGRPRQAISSDRTVALLTGTGLTVKNKRTIQYKGRAIYVASAEDTIAHKLVLGGPQDVEDAEGILLRQPHLDVVYLEQLCHKLGVAESLSRMNKEMGNSIDMN